MKPSLRILFFVCEVVSDEIVQETHESGTSSTMQGQHRESPYARDHLLRLKPPVHFDAFSSHQIRHIVDGTLHIISE